MRIFRKFIDLNVKLSRFCNLSNLSEYGTHVEYLRLAAILFSAPDVKRVMDVAAGANWQFPIAYKDAYGLELSGMDIDADAVNMNNSLEFRYVADVCRSSKIGIGNYDLLTCYSGIEHFPDVQSFLENAFASLKPGGALIAQFPSPLAPFAILNRVLPQGLKKKLLNRVFPSKADEIGHAVSYNKCRHSEFKAAAERAGFRVEYSLRFYLSSGYFTWLLPLFLLSQLVDIIRLIFGTKDMASYNLFVLRRPGEHFVIKWSWHSNF
ncbi:MAG: class I SAM-dependent methyltransferase [Beijerinckiaceae bacterium]|nr:class I SAM-dependent methyltransferase [Beijerinckiaceae bacterium]MCI0735919.1 class I SAM-dependent methyltransferase [Beijerinckiaceae bacterium]